MQKTVLISELRNLDLTHLFTDAMPYFDFTVFILAQHLHLKVFDEARSSLFINLLF